MTWKLKYRAGHLRCFSFFFYENAILNIFYNEILIEGGLFK